MTLKEIEQSDKEILTACDVADALDACPNTIRDQAQNDPSKLGFPVSVMGSRVKIPREGFLYFMKYGRPVKTINVDREGPDQPTKDGNIKEVVEHESFKS